MSGWHLHPLDTSDAFKKRAEAISAPRAQDFVLKRFASFRDRAIKKKGGIRSFATSCLAQEPAVQRLPPPRTEYLGRTIARTMHYKGAPWLIRS